MQSDEVIWQIINRGHCSYKMKTGGATFCRNKYNVTGLCNRSSCPLANSQYATIVEERGIAYLCMKTVERAHKPATLWHRIALDGNYSKALKQVDSLLAHWYTLLRDNVFVFLLMVLLIQVSFLASQEQTAFDKNYSVLVEDSDINARKKVLIGQMPPEILFDLNFCTTL